jgi:hypothetical protein
MQDEWQSEARCASTNSHANIQTKRLRFKFRLKDLGGTKYLLGMRIRGKKKINSLSSNKLLRNCLPTQLPVLFIFVIVSRLRTWRLTTEWTLQLGYLHVTVLRRGVREVRVVVGRAPAWWQVWRGMQYRRSQCFYNWTWDVCSHWKQTND